MMLNSSKALVVFILASTYQTVAKADTCTNCKVQNLF